MPVRKNLLYALKFSTRTQQGWVSRALDAWRQGLSDARCLC